MSEQRTYCRICESLCGLVATVEDGRLVRLRADDDHPLSKGFACPKGIAMAEVVNDPDRLMYPLRRKRGIPRGDGGIEQFERVSWDEALDDIGRRLKRVTEEHGGSAVGGYVGNPVYFSYSPPMWIKGFFDALKSPHYYTPGSQDTSSRAAASAYLYGSAMQFPIPDLDRTQFLLMLGANPFVSKGSLLTAPRIKDRMYDIVDRGGRIVMIDPRRTETARAFEHVPIRPDTDAWLLLAMLNVIFQEGLEDGAALAEQATGVEALRGMVRDHTPESAQARTGVPAARIRQLARDLAAAEQAAVYGRCGTCRGSHSTLVVFLIDALAIVTGNFDRPGGILIGAPMVPAAFLKGVDSFGKLKSRIGGFQDLYGMMPAGIMAREMTTPGKGQLRAFFTVGGNALLSCPNGPELAKAIKGLDLMVSIDIYISETCAHADYVLPATTFMEQEDFPLTFASMHLKPFAEWTEPVIAPRGEARQEWEIIQAISDRIGIVPSSSASMRALGKLGLKLRPEQVIDLALRLGPFGDLYGLRRGGISVEKLRRAPHGVVLGEHQSTGVRRKRIRHKDRKVHFDVPDIITEAQRLGDRQDDPRFPMSLIGMRELRTHNSWMHNPSKLMIGSKRVHTARVHPGDAAALGVGDGDLVRITSATGEIEIPVTVTDELIQGTVAVPHGWGHNGQGNWSRANRAGGVNVNVLASSDVKDLERLAGMTLLDGIPIRLERVARSGRRNGGAPPAREAAVAEDGAATATGPSQATSLQES